MLPFITCTYMYLPPTGIDRSSRWLQFTTYVHHHFVGKFDDCKNGVPTIMAKKPGRGRPLCKMVLSKPLEVPPRHRLLIGQQPKTER